MTAACVESKEKEKKDGVCFFTPHLAAAVKDGLTQPVRKT